MKYLTIIFGIIFYVCSTRAIIIDDKANTTDTSKNTDGGYQLKKRQDQGRGIALQMLRASSTDSCDWRSQPMAFIKGEICGGKFSLSPRRSL